MTKQIQTGRPRIFISHAWEDKALVRRLETELTAAGAEVWVDHIGIRGSDNLPKRIRDALEWCNTLLLVWSAQARDSHWVELEWTNAISLKKTIIPCVLGNVKLPGILANKLYLDFGNVDDGIAQLLHALNLARQPIVSAPPKPTKSKPPQILLRSQPLASLSGEAVKAMLRQHDFFCADYDWSREWSNPKNQSDLRRGRRAGFNLLFACLRVILHTLTTHDYAKISITPTLEA